MLSPHLITFSLRCLLRYVTLHQIPRCTSNTTSRRFLRRQPHVGKGGRVVRGYHDGRPSHASTTPHAGTAPATPRSHLGRGRGHRIGQRKSGTSDDIPADQGPPAWQGATHRRLGEVLVLGALGEKGRLTRSCSCGGQTRAQPRRCCTHHEQGHLLYPVQHRTPLRATVFVDFMYPWSTACGLAGRQLARHVLLGTLWPSSDRAPLVRVKGGPRRLSTVWTPRPDNMRPYSRSSIMSRTDAWHQCANT
jgi:hypothetical protein